MSFFSSLSIRELGRHVREVVHAHPKLLLLEPVPTTAYFSFHIAHVIPPTTAIHAPLRPRLYRPGVALLEVRARLRARVRIYVIEHQRLQLYVLLDAYSHGHVDDAPVYSLETGRLCYRASVPPEMY